MEYILGIIAGLCFLLIFAGLTRPKLERPQMTKEEQHRLRSLRGGVGTLVATAVEDLASWFQGRATDEKTWRGGLHARWTQQLKMANWYVRADRKKNMDIYLLIKPIRTLFCGSTSDRRQMATAESSSGQA